MMKKPLRFGCPCALFALLIGFTLPVHAATYTVSCGDTTTLIDDINAASSGNSIDLAAGCTYTFTSVADTHLGTSALPEIAVNIVINGNGATLLRDGGAPDFRFFYVVSGGSLTLNDLSLSNGRSQGGNGGSTDNHGGGGGGGMGGGGGAGGYGGGGGAGSGFGGGSSLEIGGGGGGGGGNNGAGQDGQGFPDAYLGGNGGAGVSGSGGSGGTGSSGNGGNGTGGGGGGGGGSTESTANGGNGSDGGGGGGGGYVVGQGPNAGGAGGRGGGGGGGGGGTFAGGGGSGGFGGGGGGVGETGGAGANGGFGGGGGGGTLGNKGGSGGFGGGNGDSGTPPYGCGAGAGGGAGLGGAIFVDAGGALILTATTFSDNQAEGGAGGDGGGCGGSRVSGGGGGGAGMGGAIFVDGGMATIINSTFASNAVQGGIGGQGGSGVSGGNGSGYGSAIFAEGGTVTVSDSTFSGSSASSGGAIYQHNGASVTLNNSIVANSSGGDCLGSATIMYSLMMDSANTCGASNGSGGNIVGSDPMLGTLTGSPAYFPLLTGSPAIDAGSNSLIPSGISTDERGTGYARIFNNIVDMGAYEFGSVFTLATSTPTPRPASVSGTAVSDLCANLTALTDGAVTVSGGVQNVLINGVYGNTYCRLIARDGSYVTSASEIGVESLIGLGVIDAVDVFGQLPGGASVVPFVSPVTVCLRGSGDVLFLSAGDSSRSPQRLAATSSGGFECVSLPNSGTVVLVGDPSNLPAPPTAAPQAVTLTDCRVTTTNSPLNLRAEPNTGAAVIDKLPYKLTLTATAYVPGWYQVVYLNGQGWVSAQYLSTAGNCGG